MLFSPQILVRRPPKLVVAAPAGSAWGDHGTNVALSTTTIANDTAAALAGSFSSVRGTTAWSSGKHYFEVKIITAPAAPIFIIGVMDNTTAYGAAMDNNGLDKSTGHSIFNGNNFGSSWNGVSSGPGWTLANGDVMGVALDSDGSGGGGDDGFSYLSLNNVWFLGANPATAGSSGTNSVGNTIGAGARPMLSIYNAGAGLYQLITTGAAFTYAPPSGYSEWG